MSKSYSGFKPYYKWITFNTLEIVGINGRKILCKVLNLIINGLPSILSPKNPLTALHKLSVF